jgi:hypothetical protein
MVGRVRSHVPEVETYAVGTVKARTVEAALDAIRMGDWDFTQFA